MHGTEHQAHDRIGDVTGGEHRAQGHDPWVLVAMPLTDDFEGAVGALAEVLKSNLFPATQDRGHDGKSVLHRCVQVAATG